MRFEDYFSFEAIVGDLIRWRLRGKDLGGVLPPRKDWLRAGLKGRKGVPSEVVRRQAIWRTVMRVCGGAAGVRALPDFLWGRKLLALVEEVREAVFAGNVKFEAPKMFKIEKGSENGVKKFREVASFERLLDRVILSRMTAYVRDRLESVLSESCYSFRKDASVTHQLAVAHLQKFRAQFPVGTLFVAECDIKKFFDSISHETVSRRWNEVGFEDAAGKVLEAYLGVYSASEKVRCGLPQGGSFSTVLANLVLAAADSVVKKVDDGRLFYARYCDDVVFVHPDEVICRRAMEAYQAALAKLDLPMHPVRPFVYRPADGSATEYYSIKSKGPFRWGEAGTGEPDCAPWVSFLGSQVRYDGETRIRKESIEKHIRSLGRETAAAVREIKDGKVGGALGTARPTMAAWFARFRNRLIAKGVGYVTAKVQDCGMCWASAFPNVTACADTKKQMRRLDRVREGMLCKVWSSFAKATADRQMVGDAIATSAPHPCGGKRDARPTRRYKGRPFSYSGFLEKAVRPTNMARRRIARLPYSAL